MVILSALQLPRDGGRGTYARSAERIGIRSSQNNADERGRPRVTCCVCIGSLARASSRAIQIDVATDVPLARALQLAL